MIELSNKYINLNHINNFYLFAFPILAAVLQILLLLFVFKYDSPVFYLMHNDKKNYDSVMAKIYKIYFIEFDEEVPLEVTNKPSKDISWSELFSVKYTIHLIINKKFCMKLLVF